MKKKIGIVVAAVALIALVCWGFWFVTKKANSNRAENTKLTEVQNIITRNLEKDYPPTPRQVVLFYNRIITAYYGENYTPDQYDAMIDQQLALFDDKLRANNPKEEFKATLDKDIAQYRSNNRVIANSEVCDSKDVQYKQDGEEEVAFVTASYFVKEGKNTFTRTHMEFALIKDANGNWRIRSFYKISAPSEE